MTALLLAAALVSADGPPNVLLILCDDLGYGDVSPLNPASTIPTPAFHRLAGEGMTFTDAHTPSAVCTPTRYGLLTGRYAWRSPLKKGVLGGYSKPLIEEDRSTVADVMKAAGYRTSVVGKWHLGLGWQWPNGTPKGIDNFGKQPGEGQVDFSKPIAGGPSKLGFDHNFLIPASLDMTPYVYVVGDGVEEEPTETIKNSGFPAFFRGGAIAPSFRHVEVLDRLVEEASNVISQESDKPFFLYVPFSSPHKPVVVADRFKGKGGLGPYSDFIVQTDDAVGRLLDALDASGRAEDTLVIVTSDNGSFMRKAGDGRPDHTDDPTQQAYRPDSHLANGPLRGTKADIYEAGHRVPFFVRWPGQVEAGATSDAVISLVDVRPTLALIADQEPAAEDGESMLPALLGRDYDRGPIINHSANGTFAVRDGRWKLIFSSGSGGRQKPAGKPFDGVVRLFDLSSDLAETTNVAADHPAVVKRLTAALREIAGDEVPAEFAEEK